MADVDGLAFVCPQCHEEIDINESMRLALVEYGCVVCGATVTRAAFSHPE
ncbi:MAG: hypothetical protein V5A43_01450 [Haloarculaceae archaeon]